MIMKSPNEWRHAVALRTALVDELVAKEALTAPEWIRAFSFVPRHMFVPTYYRRAADGSMRKISAYDRDRRQSWLAGVYSDDSLITAYDPDDALRLTSSSTAPSVMATMLEALDIQSGDKVLEIGTGTGYNAAILSHRVSSVHVTTLDVDAELVDRARTSLASVGYHPTVVMGNGAEGYAANAPYDRIIATCAVDRIPEAWLDQLNPGGVIVANLGYVTVRLGKRNDDVASGRFLTQKAAFMPLRDGHAQAMPFGEAMQLVQQTTGVRVRSAALPDRMADDTFSALIHLVTGGVERFQLTSDGVARHCLVDPATRSWARLDVAEDIGATVTQAGPRDLWDELETAHRVWRDSGYPPHDRLGLTVTANGTHRLWVDEPGSLHRWSLAPAKSGPDVQEQI